MNEQINPKTLLFGNLVETWDFRTDNWIACRVIKACDGRIRLEAIEGDKAGQSWNVPYDNFKDTDLYKKLGS